MGEGKSSQPEEVSSGETPREDTEAHCQNSKSLCIVWSVNDGGQEAIGEQYRWRKSCLYRTQIHWPLWYCATITCLFLCFPYRWNILNTYALFLIKLNIHLSCDPASVFSGIYPRERKTCYVHIKPCTRMFKTGLFTIAPDWKGPKCPSKGEWINKLWYVYTME